MLQRLSCLAIGLAALVGCGATQVVDDIQAGRPAAANFRDECPSLDDSELRTIIILFDDLKNRGVTRDDAYDAFVFQASLTSDEAVCVIAILDAIFPR